MRRFFIVGIILLALIATPIVAYFLISQKTSNQTHASPASSLLFEAVNSPIVVGQAFSIVIDVNPTSGGTSNAVSFVKVDISYDGSKLQATNNSLVPSSIFSTTIAAPINICNGNACTLSATFSVGPDLSKAVTTQTPVGTITFTPLAPTDQNAPISLGFVSGQNQILSVPINSQPAQNVFTQGIPASIVILPSSNTSLISPTPTTVATSNSANTTATNSLFATPTTATSNQLPVCTNLTVTQVATDASGFTYQLTATGVDSYGTIGKITFAFGDGNVQTVTSGPTIGTNSVNGSASHMYTASGIYTASAFMTDNNSQTSTPTSCSQSVTVGLVAQGNGSNDQTATPSPTLPPTTLKTLPTTGPGNALVTIGLLGTAMVILGAIFVIGF